MKKHFLMMLMAFSMLFGSVQAQTNSIDNVLNVRLRSSGEIIQDDQVKGYYFFYKVDRVDRKNSLYNLTILDANLNQVSSQEIVTSKYSYLTEGSFNGTHLMMEFYDAKKKEYSWRLFDQQAQQIKEIALGEHSIYMNPIRTDNDEIRSNYLFAIPGNGFMFYNMVKNKKLGYEIKHFNNQGVEDWSFESPKKSDLLEAANFLVADDDIIVNNLAVRPKLMSTKGTKSTILGIDAKTGKERFEVPLNDKKNDLIVLNGFFNTLTGNIMVMGMTYKPGEAPKGKSTGLFALQIDRDGEVVSDSRLSWTKEVAEFIPVNEKGKLDDVGYLYFHQIVQDNQGRFYAIAEQYRRSVSALGVAVLAMGGGASATKLVTEDMMVFEFSPEFALEGVEFFDKTKNDVYLPLNVDFVSIQVLGMLMDVYDGFDYNFTQTNRGKSMFAATYIDYEKIKGERNKFVFGAIVHSDDEYTVDKINLETDAAYLSVMQAKPGHVMIAEYDKKAKRINLRLEPINY